jgi:NAD(P)-dependent dehydrogenase (short-subunit alcohol dehydrogenase family)
MFFRQLNSKSLLPFRILTTNQFVCSAKYLITPIHTRGNLIQGRTFQPQLTRPMASTSQHNEELKVSNLFDVSHVTAIVTGGGSGIGLMITQALASNGAKVYITGRREEALKKVVDQYNTGPGEIIALPGDVNDKADIERLASEMSKKEPEGIQLLVNNAGIARDDNTKFSSAGEPDMEDPVAISKHFMKSDPQSWADTFQTNSTGPFFVSMAFLPQLAKGGNKTPGYASSVINVSSISGQMRGTSGGQPAYAASKAASTHISRMLATTFKDTKVRVNTIAPGVFPSEVCFFHSVDVDSQTRRFISARQNAEAEMRFKY